jgi:hypothetical protein
VPTDQDAPSATRVVGIAKAPRRVRDDPAPALAQVIPVEALLLPGQKQQFQVSLFNKRGQFLKKVPTADVKFSIAGPGKIDAEGKRLRANGSLLPPYEKVTSTRASRSFTPIGS